MPLTEWDIRPFVRFNDLYVRESSAFSNYLQEEVVIQIDVAAEDIDTRTIRDCDLTYAATVDRDLYDAYISAQDSLAAYEVPADEASEAWRIDNVEYSGLEIGTEYTVLATYLVTAAVTADAEAEASEDATIGSVPPALLRDADGAIAYSEVSFVPKSESGELQIDTEI